MKSKLPSKIKSEIPPNFKYFIMTEDERTKIELILQKKKIPSANFIASYEVKVFG
jgi:tRNA 2-selenouridine synthase SelU